MTAYQYERALGQETPGEPDDPFWDDQIAVVARCLAAYREAIAPLLARWEADPDPTVRQIADAVKRGDYSILAF